MELTLEQKFDIQAFAILVEQQSEEEVKRSLVEMYERLVIMDTEYKERIKEKWGF